MAEQRMKVRDKKVQKMTKDGLVEENLTDKSSVRVSNRVGDVQMGRKQGEKEENLVDKSPRQSERSGKNIRPSVQKSRDAPELIRTEKQSEDFGPVSYTHLDVYKRQTHEDAVRAYKATELWLKDRLGLEISPDKSKVVNLKRQYSDFLGFKLKIRKKGKKYVVRSHMSDKAYKKAHEKVSEEVKKLAHSSDDNAQFMQLQKYNSVAVSYTHLDVYKRQILFRQYRDCVRNFKKMTRNQKRSEAVNQRKTCIERSKDSKRRGREKTTE